jgi:hypothetical protein
MSWTRKIWDMIMTTPFDYVNSINYGKKNMMRDTENDSFAEKDYSPWLTNLALSYFPDTILYANDMNMNSDIDNRPQYEYLLNAIRRGKRYSEWVKNKKSDDLIMVMRTYNCSPTVAQGYLTLLTKDQLDQIRSTTTIGGPAN